MNLPNNEVIPDDPERLPPARRRRAHRLLAPFEADERSTFLDSLAQRIYPSIDFFLFSLLAGLVISVGLFVDAPSLLVLGALVAPFMGPGIGVSLGAVTGSVRFFGRSLVGFVIGSLLVFGTGMLAGLAVQTWAPLGISQASMHAQLAWPDFVVLIMGAVLSATALVNSEHNPSYMGGARVASVALAYEFYVPLAAAGMGLLSGLPHLFPDGLVVYSIHLAWAFLILAITLTVLGFRPLTLFGYTFGGAVALLGVILVIGIGSAGAAFGGKIALPTPLPTLTSTPVPPTLTPTTTDTPVPPTYTPLATLAPTATETATPPFTPTPTPMYAFIHVLKTDGAVVREQPGFNGKYLRSYFNGTLVIVLPDTEVADGNVWAHVIVPSDKTEGWIVQSLLLVATPAPNW
jgi:uncharacterized membrane protein